MTKDVSRSIVKDEISKKDLASWILNDLMQKNFLMNMVS